MKIFAFCGVSLGPAADVRQGCYGLRVVVSRSPARVRR
jgi:hypothetical protein